MVQRADLLWDQCKLESLLNRLEKFESGLPRDFLRTNFYTGLVEVLMVY